MDEEKIKNSYKETAGSLDAENITNKKIDSEYPKKPNSTYLFAIVTLVSIFFSLGSLTVVSERQSALAESEADMRTLQERITASIFLTLDAGSPSDTLESKSIIDPSNIKTNYLELSKNISLAKQEISGGREEINKDYELYYLINVFSLSSLASNTLLGILLISCGVLGSVMSTMRDGKGEVSKTVVLGASVGFVALLGVKGGSTIFIMTSAGIDVPFNPYSTAFVGVVAGMFSEKLYLALSKVTDKAFGDDGNQGNHV